MNYLAQSGLDGAAAAAWLLLAIAGPGLWAASREGDLRRIAPEIAALTFWFLGFLTLMSGALSVVRDTVLIFPAATSLLGLVGLWRLRREARRLIPQDAFEWTAVGALALLLGYGFLASLGPELEPDALSYHLPAAVDWAAGRDPYHPQNYPTGYPLLGEAAFAYLARLGRPEAARVFHFLVMMLAVAATAALGRRVADRRTGLLAAVLLAGVPLVIWTGQTANVDALGMLFVLLGLLRLDEHFSDGDARPLYSAGLFFGLAAATGLWNMLYVPLFGAAALGFWLRLARQKKATVGVGLLRVSGFFSFAVVVYGLWALRATFFVGDPLFPLLQRFGDGPGAEFFRFIAEQNQANYGTGHSWLDLLLVGWNVTFAPERFGHLPIGWLLLPLATFGIVTARRTPLLRLTLPVGAVAGLVWFATHQEIRLLAPLLPIAAVLAAAAVVRLVHADLRFPRLRRAAPFVVLALALSGLAPLAAASWPDAGFVTKVHWPLLTGRATRDQVRERFAYNDEWALWRFANAALPDDAKLRGEGAVQGHFWARRKFVDAGRDGGVVSSRLREALEMQQLAEKQTGPWLSIGRPDPAADACVIYTNGYFAITREKKESGGAEEVASPRSMDGSPFSMVDEPSKMKGDENDAFRRPRAEKAREGFVSTTCPIPPLAEAEPYRWVEVASPRDVAERWWIGAQARLLVHPNTRLEIVAPLAAQGVTELTVTAKGHEPARLSITGKQTILPPGTDLTFTAAQTIMIGDTAKSFVVRVK